MADTPCATLVTPKSRTSRTRAAPGISPACEVSDSPASRGSHERDRVRRSRPGRLGPREVEPHDRGPERAGRSGQLGVGRGRMGPQGGDDQRDGGGHRAHGRCRVGDARGNGLDDSVNR